MVTLREIADRLGMTTGTVSAVLNDTPSARSIPEPTRQLIRSTARELKYRPNFLARSLRGHRTFTIGLMVEEIGDSYGFIVASGVEACLRQHKYSFLTVVHRHDPAMLREHSQLLIDRGVEGIVTVDAMYEEAPPLPTVCVAGHRAFEGVTNIILDQKHGIRLGLEHLVRLGHRKVAYLKGQPTSSDSEERWQAICEVGQELGLTMDPDLIAYIETDDTSPQLGYPYARQLLARRKPFTALFAYNDISALGAIRAIQEDGLRVPQDISVVGFDDIQWAAFNTPSLTTVRQPLVQMGQIAGETIIGMIENNQEYSAEIVLKPTLVVRESTGPCAR